MLKAIKLRIYPNREQADFISRQLGCCRFVYNKCLAFRKDSYNNEHVSISSAEAVKHIVDLKKDNEWLKEVHSKVLQQSVRDMNQAYDNFFKLHRGFPNFKSKHDFNQSCRFPKDAFIGVRGNRIDLIKSLKNILFRCSRKDEIYLNRNQDKVRNITLRRTPCGFYYLSVLIDKPIRTMPEADAIVGIDLGVKDFVITSEGEVFENPHFKKSESRRLKRLQRAVSKKVEGSKNRAKARVRLAKKYQKITDRKQDYMHRVSDRLVSENQTIIMEDLNVKGMLRNHKLAEAIAEVNLGEFRRMLEYKCAWYGRNLIYVSRWFPSSKTCHCCGYIKKDLTLADREWTCPACGEHHDRDVNAALNIKAEGLRLMREKIRLSSPEFTLVDYPTMDDKAATPLRSSDRLKQENNVFNDFH